MGFALKQYVLEETSCCVCATRFAVDGIIMANRRANAGSIYCPNGHSIGWSASEADRLRKELSEERQKSSMRQASLEAAERGRKQAEQKVKRITVRVDSGVCPHCNRTFKQLVGHMKCKHSKEPA